MYFDLNLMKNDPISLNHVQVDFEMANLAAGVIEVAMKIDSLNAIASKNLTRISHFDWTKCLHVDSNSQAFHSNMRPVFAVVV